ncbi:MAG: hypothetical protein A3J63_01440 [Candidatus Moranbacteria bacterium RIFCSPHIGHO2_02_FULL_40_12b]|nr:MAG: hypothetical protein A3J63_01440 [Candidatus Moranbacteria bacterium RIFCSPHIGHO2_02_FULL_40_12b]OGI23829.1 MAG: hypothetical protein A3E91_00335 [Candidatus Moranbacteria bacterium RIFCSPHIGHO2_12_FULL_40_10]
MSKSRVDDKKKKERYKKEIIKILDRVHLTGRSRKKKVIEIAFLVGFGKGRLRILELNEVLFRAFQDLGYSRDELKKITDEVLAELDN